jgi:hypothetical protein
MSGGHDGIRVDREVVVQITCPSSNDLEQAA